MAVTYFRVLITIARNPGLVPKPADTERPATKPKSRWSRKNGESDVEKNTPSSADSSDTGLEPKKQPGFLDRGGVLDGRCAPPPGLDEFSSRVVYECDIDGLPRWCPTCYSWKPDRSHHSSELGRCVYKMDHYCPWAGGVIAENNFKFFIQFCFYTASYCLFVLIVTAYYLDKIGSRPGGVYKIDWIVTIVLAALFFCFTFAMTANSIQFVVNNTGTIDSLNRTTRAYNFAVRIPPDVLAKLLARHPTSPALEGAHPDPLGESGLPFHTISYPLGSNQAQRVYAVLQLPPSKNPYKLKSSSANFKEVFGSYIWDWLLPITHSPCARHGPFGSAERDGHLQGYMYPTGPAMESVMEVAGLREEQGATTTKAS